MTKQVLYDATYGYIMQWQDTEEAVYDPPQQGAALQEVTTEQWENQNAYRYVVDGILGDVAPPPPPPSRQDVIQSYRAETRRFLNDQAMSMGFEGIDSAVTYADEPSFKQFQDDGIALRKWRSLVWKHATERIAAIGVVTSPIPALADLVASLPPFTAS